MSSKEFFNSILPKDAILIINADQEIKGILTNDGSFDLTPEGAKFLEPIRPEDIPEDYRIENAGITAQGIFINAG